MNLLNFHRYLINWIWVIASFRNCLYGFELVTGFWFHSHHFLGFLFQRKYLTFVGFLRRIWICWSWIAGIFIEVKLILYLIALLISFFLFVKRDELLSKCSSSSFRIVHNLRFVLRDRRNELWQILRLLYCSNETTNHIPVIGLIHLKTR